jgi:hypothetical protein
MVDKPPTQDPILQTGVRPWELTEHRPNLSAGRAAYRTYSTYVLDYFCRAIFKGGSTDYINQQLTGVLQRQAEDHRVDTPGGGEVIKTVPA